MAYLGASPLASFASPSKDTFSGDNSTTSFTMGQSVGDPNQIEVFVDNVRQEPTSAYTVNGTTLSFTGTPATGSNNIYVIHKQGVIGNGLLPTSGRDSDRIGSLTVTGASTLTGNITTSGNISATSGSITAGGALSGVTTLTTSSTATIGGDTAISGNLRSDTSADGIQLDASDGSATDAGDLVLLDGTDGSATNAGSSLLYEDGTGDPANYFNNDITFSGDVNLSKSVTAKTQVIESPGATTTLDFETNQNFIVKLGANLTLSNSATGNLNIGQTGVIVFIQDATGSRTLTLSSDFESPAAAGITLTTTAKATDIVPYIILGPNRILLGTPQLAFG
tara:strand:+ start:1047 stop:2057 length:1011 start_codon:yes stop_codon:yes gene_type:complete